MTQARVVWTWVGHTAFALAAFAAVVLAMWLIDRWRRHRPTSRAVIVAVLASAVWALLEAALGAPAVPTQLADVVRNLAWLAVVHALFARDGRHESVRPVRPVLVVLALVEALQVVLLVLVLRTEGMMAVQALVFRIAVLQRLLVIAGALVLVHNLYAGAIAGHRTLIWWTCGALALLWGYDLNFFTIAYIVQGWPVELVAMRGVVALFALALVATGALRAETGARFSPSRTVAFQSLSLLVIGGYMLAMVGLAKSIAWLGGSVSVVVQLGFALATTMLVLALMPSARLRRWLNVMLSKHFFQHRYDYRAEWLRFTRTIGRSGEGELPLHTRVVQAVADITDSARGALLVPGDAGELVLAARWQWPTLDVPAGGIPAASAAFLERQGFIVDLDELRAGVDHEGELLATPPWLVADETIWALVPLLHFDRLVGLVVLGRPPVARKLDWEDFDLLRVVGQTLASYIAEASGQQALMDATRFDEFNRRIAFVMHDIKNLASQLSLLARNAERHADNPAFRQDMLLTLGNAADKLNALLSRLSRYGTGHGDKLGETEGPLDARGVVEGLAARWPSVAGRAQVTVDAGHARCPVRAPREALEQVLTHLVQNAVDASPADAVVRLAVSSEVGEVHITVSDTGSGMSAEFVRNALFRPFVSTKPGGFGIGAFEARELVKAMRGRLEVESREGAGTRFAICLPLAGSEAAITNDPAPGALMNTRQKVA